MSSKKSLKSFINTNNIASLISHQRKRNKCSSTFNKLGHDNYSTALNFHQDNNRYTSKN